MPWRIRPAPFTRPVVSAVPVSTTASPRRPNPPKHDPGDSWFTRHLLGPLIKRIFRKVYADLRSGGRCASHAPRCGSARDIPSDGEQTPELTLALVDDVAHAVTLFNRYSPQFVASLIGGEQAEHESFYAAINAPFVGDADTRWVDGQKALDKPELGLSNPLYGHISKLAT